MSEVDRSVVLPRFREIHDVSIPLTPETPVWPGDPPFEASPVQRIERGSSYNLSELRLGTHTGTHIDAPRHIFRGGAAAHRIPLDALCGPALVLDVTGAGQIRRRDVENAWRIARTELVETSVSAQQSESWTRILLKSAGSSRWKSPHPSLDQGFPGLTEGAASFLVDRGICLVGIDGPSIDADDDLLPAHRLLLGAGIVVVECLDLSQVECGPWFLCCLPLPVMDTDGAPARAILARA